MANSLLQITSQHPGHFSCCLRSPVTKSLLPISLYLSSKSRWSAFLVHVITISWSEIRLASCDVCSTGGWGSIQALASFTTISFNLPSSKMANGANAFCDLVDHFCQFTITALRTVYETPWSWALYAPVIVPRFVIKNMFARPITDWGRRPLLAGSSPP